MDLILESNKSSTILRSLADSEVIDLSYEISPSFPLLAKKYVQLSANGGALNAAMNSQEIVFNIPKANLLRDMYIRTTFTTTTTALDVTRYPGLRMFESISVRTQNRTLGTVSDVALISRVDDSPTEQKCYMTKLALPLMNDGTDAVQATSTAASATYTPVFSIFTEDIKNALDLAFYEQVQLVCRFNTVARAGFPATTTIAESKLWVWTYRPDDKYMSMLRAKNQNPSRPLNMLGYDTFTERLACTSTTSTTIRLQTNYPVMKTIVMVNPVVTAAVGVPVRINSFSFKVGGVTLLDTVPYLIGNWESAKHGSSIVRSTGVAGTPPTLGFSSDDNCGVVINWNMLPKDYTSCSGACSFSQLNTPEIVVNYPTLTAASYEIAVVHFYHNILTLETGGLISVSVAS